VVGRTDYRTRTEQRKGAETGRKERSKAAGRRTQRSGSRSTRELAERTRSARPCASCAAHSLSRARLRAQARKRASAPRASKRGARRTAHAHCAQIARGARTHAPRWRARGREGGRAPSNRDIVCRPLPSFATDRLARRAWLVSGVHLARDTLFSTPTIPLALVVLHPFLAGSPYPCTTPPFVHDRRKATASKTRLPFFR